MDIKETRARADNLARRIIFEGEREATRIRLEAKQRAKQARERIMEGYFVDLGAPQPVGEAERYREYELGFRSKHRPPTTTRHPRLSDRGVVSPRDPY